MCGSGEDCLDVVYVRSQDAGALGVHLLPSYNRYRSTIGGIAPQDTASLLLFGRSFFLLAIIFYSIIYFNR